jgi:integrase
VYCRELEQAEGLTASGQGAGPYGSRRIRFRDFADEFEEYKAAHVKSSSLKRYKTALKIFVYAFGDRYLTGITQADIERYIAARSRAVKPWTVVGEITILKQMFNVSLAFHTGMRRGELLGLTRDRIRLDQRTIFLPDTKMGESQTVHLNDSAAEELRAIPCDQGILGSSISAPRRSSATSAKRARRRASRTSASATAATPSVPAWWNWGRTSGLSRPSPATSRSA